MTSGGVRGEDEEGRGRGILGKVQDTLCIVTRRQSQDGEDQLSEDVKGEQIKGLRAAWSLFHDIPNLLVITNIPAKSNHSSQLLSLNRKTIASENNSV